MNAKTSFKFEGLEELLVGVRRLTNDIAYFTLRDRSVEGESQIGRIDFEPSSLSPYVSAPTPASGPACFDDATDDDADDDDELEPGDEEDASFDDEHDASAPVNLQNAMQTASRLEFDHATLLTAACRWIRESAICAGRTLPAMHLHLKVYAPKGARVIFSGSFFMQNLYFNKSLADTALRAAQESEARKAVSSSTPSPSPTHALTADSVPTDALSTDSVSTEARSGVAFSMIAPDAPVASFVPTSPSSAAARVPTPVGSPTSTAAPIFPGISSPPPSMLLYPANYQDGSLFGTVGAFRALNEGYTQFGSAMMHGIGQLQDMMNQVLRDRGEELGQYRDQVNQLINHVLEFRVKEVEAQTDVLQAQVTDQRTALARDAITQLGDTARAFFVSRGVSPELVDLLNSIGSNPELLGVLQEPSVKAMLSDPENQRALAISLRQIGQQQQALKMGAGAPSPGGASSMPSPAVPAVQLPQPPPVAAYGTAAFGGGARHPGVYPGGSYARDAPGSPAYPGSANTSQAQGVYTGPPFYGPPPPAYGHPSPHPGPYAMPGPGYASGYPAPPSGMGWPSAAQPAGPASSYWPPASSHMPPAGAWPPNHAHYPMPPVGAASLGAVVGAVASGAVTSGAEVGAAHPGEAHSGAAYAGGAGPGASIPTGPMIPPATLRGATGMSAEGYPDRPPKT